MDYTKLFLRTLKEEGIYSSYISCLEQQVSDRPFCSWGAVYEIFSHEKGLKVTRMNFHRVIDLSFRWCLTPQGQKYWNKADLLFTNFSHYLVENKIA